MKTLLFLSFLLASLFSWSQAIYGSISGGYQFGVGKQNLEHHSVTDFIDPYSPWSWQQVDLSLGKGVQTNFTVGYDFKQHYGVSITGSYLFGAEFSSKATSSSDVTYERKLSANMLRINPSFRMYVGENRFRTYAEIGLILGIGKIDLTNSVNVTDTILQEYNYLYDGGVSFGANARFGLEFKLSKRLNIFGEFNFNSQAYAPQKGHLTKYIYNNVDMTEAYKHEIIFVDQLESDPTIVVVPNQPEVRAKHSYPFHSYGLTIGVKYILWEKKKEESSEI